MLSFLIPTITDKKRRVHIQQTNKCLQRMQNLLYLTIKMENHILKSIIIQMMKEILIVRVEAYYKFKRKFQVQLVRNS